MTLAEKIERLQAHGLYDIHFRNAGVGLTFYEGPRDEEGSPCCPECGGAAHYAVLSTGTRIPAEQPCPNRWHRDRNEWRRYLAVQRYYRTLEEAVDAELANREAKVNA